MMVIIEYATATATATATASRHSRSTTRIYPVGAGSTGLGGGVSALQKPSHVQSRGPLQLRKPVPRVPSREQLLHADPHPVLGHGRRARHHGLRRREGFFAGCGAGELVPRAQLPDVGVSRLHIRSGAPRAQVLRVQVLVAPVFPARVHQPECDGH